MNPHGFRITRIREFIEGQTRQVSRAWISNQALYMSFLRWMEVKGWRLKPIMALISFQSFGRFLGRTLKIPNIRHWIDGRQIYGRQLWPLEEIRQHLAMGIDYL